MIKLRNLVLDRDFKLLGFILEGTRKEFGQIGNPKEIITEPVHVQNLLDKGFKNKQISVVKNKGGRRVIQEIGNFKLNSLPALMFDGESYVEADNSIEITKRYELNNKNVGFDIKYSNGVMAKVTYEQLVVLANWLQIKNFVLRVSPNGVYYISGKPGGIKLDELPVEVIGDESTAKRRKSSSVKDKAFNSVLPTDFDILDIYDFIKDCHGCIINLPTEKYEAVDDSSEVDAKAGFVSLGIGEVGSMYPMFNTSNLNVNAPFKKVGVVNVDMGGQTQKMTTFVHRSKSIFLRGENHIKRFGIAVPVEYEENLVKSLGGSLAIRKITDETITKPLGQVIDSEGLAFYEVDTSNIGLISTKKQKESIIQESDLITLIKKRFTLNLITKSLGARAGLIKELKEKIGESNVEEARDKKLFGIYSMMNADALNRCIEAGIDVYSGAFDTNRAIANKGLEVPKKAYSKSEDDSISIEYILKGYDASKISYKIIKEAAAVNDTTKVPKVVIDTYRNIVAITDIKEMLAEAERVHDKAMAEYEELTRKLWMHEASMYLQGNKAKVHMHNARMWEPEANAKLKSGMDYRYTGKTAEGLVVRLKNLSI